MTRTKDTLIKILFVAIVFAFVFNITIDSYANTATITETVVNVREQPDSNSEKVVRLTSGTIVDIIEKDGEWYKIEYGSKTGYIREDLLTLNGEIESQSDEDEEVVEPEVEEEVQEVEPEPEVEEETTPEQEEQSQDTVTTNTYKISTLSNIQITPSINSLQIGTIVAGTQVTIEETLGNWKCVVTNDLKGWVASSNITTSEEVIENAETPEESQDTAQETGKTKYINSNRVNFRDAASSSSNVIGTLLVNAEVELYEDLGEWSRIKEVSTGKEGYVSSSLLSNTMQETSRNSEEIRIDTTVVEETDLYVPSLASGSSIVTTAMSYLGGSYVYGGTTPAGFDCSGFTQYVYAIHGITVGRTALNQSYYGTPISKTELEPGDMVLFGSPINHVGIYIGNGNMVHAANTNRGIVIDTINSGYYNTNYVGARRF